MQLITTNPWRIVNGFSRDFERLVRDVYARDAWTPAVDVAETETHYVFSADLPGVKRENVDITVDERVLAIEGSRETESSTQDNGLRRTERLKGRFARRFRLPELADPEQIEATYVDGVLTVKVAKQAVAEPRRIEVKAH